MPAHVLAFAGVAAVLVAIPGPAVTLVMKNAALRGGRSALVTALGVLSADLVWAAASVLGLTAVLVASAPAFLVVKLLGAGYLVYLGVRLLLRPGVADDAGGAAGPPPAAGAGRAFREGVLCDLSNPKTLLVFAGVIPQFVPAGGTHVDLALFGLVFALIGFAALVVYAAVFSSARSVVSRPRVTRWLMRAGGAVLTGFGVSLVATSPA